jgi:uncharacterized membrane protein
VILLTPILFWILATGVDIASRDPEAFETPLALLAFTWVLYLPVFGMAGVLLMAGQRFVIPRHSQFASWIGAVAGAGLSLVGVSIAAVAYDLPLVRVWRLSMIVGAAMGAIVLRMASSDSSDSVSMK